MKALTRLRRTTLSCLFVTSFVLLIALFNGNGNRNSLGLSRVVQDSKHQQAFFQEGEASVISRRVPVFFGRKTDFPIRELQNSKRQASVDFGQLELKGAASLCDMKKSNELYPNLASQFKSFNDIATYGWSILGDFDPEFKNALNDAFEDLQASDVDNKPIHVKHDQESKVSGKTYKKTDAFFMNVFNPKAGFIVADNNLSPQAAIIKFNLGIKGDDVVKLRSWSDLTFLLWQSQAGGAIKNLKGIFRATVTNQATNDLIEDIFGFDVPETWENRATFTMDSSEGKMFLGSPNGQGVAFFLIQHKAQLGVKQVESVSVWEQDGYQFYFKIGDVPAGEIDG